MTLYETVIIIHPDQGGRAKEFIDRFKKIIEDIGATGTQVEEWGIRDLSYRIQKQTKGHYHLIRYQASASAVEELERNLKLSDGVIRYLTVRLEGDAPLSARPGPKDLSRGVKRGSEQGLTKLEPES